MTTPESQEIRALRTIAGRTKGPPKQFTQKIQDLDHSVDFMAEYLIIMQKGIDDAQKDIIQKIQDAINDLIILFSGGTDALDFDWGDFEVVVRNLQEILNLPDFTNDVDLLSWANEFFLDIIDTPIINNTTSLINSFIADLLDAIDGATGSIFNLDDLADSLRITQETAVVADTNAATAQITANNAQAQIQELINDTNAGEAGGLSIVRKFTGESGAGVANFTGASSPSNAIGVIDDNAGWIIYGSTVGQGWMKHNTDSTVDDMESSVTFGTSLYEIAYTGCFIRANSAMTYAWGIRVYYDQIQIGYISNWSGGNFTWNQVAQIVRNSHNGDIFRVRAVGDLYTVYHNGYPIYNATNASRPKGASYRGHGFWTERRQLIYYASGPGIYQYAFSELPPIVTAGTGWDFFRSVTSVTSDIPDGYNQWTVDVFDTNRRTSNMTVNSIPRGIVTCTKAGYYLINSRYQINLTNDDDDDCRPLVYYKPAGGSWGLADVGPSHIGGLSIGWTSELYGGVGDQFGAGFVYTKLGIETPTKVLGDTLGTVSYFKGILIPA